MEVGLALLAVILLFGPLILSIVALSRVRTALGNLTQIQKFLGVLEQRLFALERLAGSMGAAPTPPGAPAPAKPPAEPAVAPAPPAPQPAPPPVAAPPLAPGAKLPSQLDLETVIAGRWLNRIGILALIFAVSFFLKYAFDNNWIGPRGRVGIGLLLGAAMLPWSNWLLKRGYPYFSEGIAGLGEAVLYLSWWAGWHYYALFSQGVAFASMIVVTAVMAAFALGRNSQRIAGLALVGGFLTPAIVSTGRDQQIVLFTYLAILGAGFLLMAASREWRWLTPASFIATLVYFWGWYADFYNAAKLERTTAFATLFFLLYAAIPVMRASRLARLADLDVALVLVNAGAFLVALRAMLWPEHRWPLTVFVLALSAAHLSVARHAPPPREGEAPLTRFLFAGLALTFVTLAMPIRLDGKWITTAWAVEGTILVWTGLRARTRGLRAAGYFLLAVTAFRLAVIPIAAARFLFNARFATFAVFVAGLAASLRAAQLLRAELGKGEEEVFGVMAVGLNVYALWALSWEFWDLFGRMATLQLDRGLAQHLALSLLWTAYATALILLGVVRKSAFLRWQALVLYGLVVAKVFLYDTSFLERFYRILSFLILGLVLLVVSFLYQRKISRERGQP